MELYKMTTPKDEAWRVVEALGHQNLVQFMNMNEKVDVANLLYKFRVSQCDATEKRILTLLSACEEYNIKIFRPADPI